MPSLEDRKKRLGLRRLSLRAGMLKERCVGVGIEFRELMQADFILFMRDGIEHPDSGSGWRPETLLYAHHQHSPCEILARAQSAREFDKVKVLLGVDSKEALETAVEAMSQSGMSLPRWEFQSFDPSVMLGLERLATRD